MSGMLVLLCRLIVGGVFIYASLDKLANPQAFAEVIHHYRIVPMALLHPAALLLPMVEFVVGAALVLGLGRRGAALILAALLVVFMGGIGSALLRNLDISCGCFNTDGGHAVGLSLLGRDLGLLLLCLPPLLLRNGGPGFERTPHK
jgi:uncharacterized membrane protein YphA (DoxX/SURF4 family)